MRLYFLLEFNLNQRVLSSNRSSSRWDYVCCCCCCCCSKIMSFTSSIFFHQTNHIPLDFFFISRLLHEPQATFLRKNYSIWRKKTQTKREKQKQITDFLPIHRQSVCEMYLHRIMRRLASLVPHSMLVSLSLVEMRASRQRVINESNFAMSSKLMQCDCQVQHLHTSCCSHKQHDDQLTQMRFVSFVFLSLSFYVCLSWIERIFLSFIRLFVSRQKIQQQQQLVPTSLC